MLGYIAGLIVVLNFKRYEWFINNFILARNELNISPDDQAFSKR